MIYRVPVLLCVVLVALTSCTRSATYSELVATAAVAGCWPGSTLPPPPVTVTPVGYPTLIRPGSADPMQPTLTPLPTTTPYVQCPPAPGETVQPWPTPIPPVPAHPTPKAQNRPSSTHMQSIMQLADAALTVDIAVHPISGDPVVAAIGAPLTSSGNPHAYVRAYNLTQRTWGSTQSVDIGRSVIAQHRFRSVALGVAGDGTITVVYGVTAFPTMGMWLTQSHDTGATWTEPELVATNMFGVLDVAVALDGTVLILALQREPTRPILLTRDADGTWSQPDALPVSAVWYGSSGALVLQGAGADARITALITAAGGSSAGVYLASRSLTTPGAWHTDLRQVAVPRGQGLFVQARGIGGERTIDGLLQQTIGFSFGQQEAGGVYSVSSLDGGRTWSAIMPIAQADTNATLFSVLGYDVTAGRFVAFWSCCADARWGSAASTHYSAWNVPGAAAWQPDQPVPVISGAVAAADMALAQAANSQYAWMAWIEHGTTIAVRGVDLNHTIPESQYPEPTPLPTATQVQP